MRIKSLTNIETFDVFWNWNSTCSTNHSKPDTFTSSSHTPVVYLPLCAHLSLHVTPSPFHLLTCPNYFSRSHLTPVWPPSTLPTHLYVPVSPFTLSPAHTSQISSLRNNLTPVWSPSTLPAHLYIPVSPFAFHLPFLDTFMYPCHHLPFHLPTPVRFLHVMTSHLPDHS